ncbi:MAG: ChaN family lipoprotein [Deferrisomatales bacterium]
MRLAPLALAGLLLAGCAAPLTDLRVDSPYRDPATLEKGQILHAATGRLLTRDELAEYLRAFPVIYVGETHDSVDSHAVQLAILQDLSTRLPGEVALGLEMLQRTSQPEVDRWLRGEMEEKEFLRLWQENWAPSSFPYYRDILAYARDRGIPVRALNAERDLRRALAGAPPEDLDPALRERLPELSFDDPHYQAFLEAMFRGHEAGDAAREGFLRVQVLWDETMAQTAAEYLTGVGRGKRLVILAGSNHVRHGFGIPRRLFRRVPLPYAIVDSFAVEVPEAKRERFMNVDLPPIPLRAVDVYWATGYEDLEGDRVLLGVQLETDEDARVRVRGVLPGSPAERAGVRAGDVIAAIDGEPVKELFDVTYRVGLRRPGETGPLEVLREEERLTLEIVYDVLRHGE